MSLYVVVAPSEQLEFGHKYTSFVVLTYSFSHTGPYTSINTCTSQGTKFSPVLDGEDAWISLGVTGSLDGLCGVFHISGDASGASSGASTNGGYDHSFSISPSSFAWVESEFSTGTGTFMCCQYTQHIVAPGIKRDASNNAATHVNETVESMNGTDVHTSDDIGVVDAEGWIHLSSLSDALHWLDSPLAPTRNEGGGWEGWEW